MNALDRDERYEKLVKLIEDLRHDADMGKIIVVEGKKDVASLKKLGISGRVLAVKSGRGTLVDVLSELSFVEEVILLPDFDPAGHRLLKKMVEELEHMRVKADTSYWMRFRGVTQGQVKDIEGIATLVESWSSERGMPPKKLYELMS